MLCTRTVLTNPSLAFFIHQNKRIDASLASLPKLFLRKTVYGQSPRCHENVETFGKQTSFSVSKFWLIPRRKLFFMNYRNPIFDGLFFRWTFLMNCIWLVVCIIVLTKKIVCVNQKIVWKLLHSQWIK